LESFNIIAFTHKNLPLELIGKLHLPEEEQSQVLQALKVHYGFQELVCLNTCNRVELLIKSPLEINTGFLTEMVLFINGRLRADEAAGLAAGAEVYGGLEAVEHLLRVASSLDSMVVGEREIITQVRKAYDHCNKLGFTGDYTRLLIKQTIEAAKEIYTTTGIARNPVSVASLAYRQLRNLGIRNDARIIFVGSGETNTVLANYFKKHQFANFTVFNRTLENARKLARVLNGESYQLNEIVNFKSGFDVLVVCTASTEPVITGEIYSSLKAGETSRKVVIDLGMPSNVAPEVSADKQSQYIDINSLKAQAEINLQLRKGEMVKCEAIIKERAQQFASLYEERKIEVAFGSVPKQVKAIRELAVNEVFAREINAMDLHGKEVLEKVLAYVEKKYNAVAIKTAKEVLLSKN
jgi:glutamyl-tRNA reductase